MIRKLLRKDLIAINQQTLRGGHGWDRPDVPLSLNYQYKHKREISIYDINMWFYDQSQPEYAINNGEIYLGTPLNVFKEIMSKAALIGAFGLGLVIFLHITQHGFAQAQTSEQFLQSAVHQKKTYFNDRVPSRRNFLGLDLTGENGWIFAKYDNPSLLADYEKSIQEESVVSKINQEGKNFVIKLEEEVIQKLKKQL